MFHIARKSTFNVSLQCLFWLICSSIIFNRRSQLNRTRLLQEMILQLECTCSILMTREKNGILINLRQGKTPTTIYFLGHCLWPSNNCSPVKDAKTNTPRFALRSFSSIMCQSQVIANHKITCFPFHF